MRLMRLSAAANLAVLGVVAANVLLWKRLRPSPGEGTNEASGEVSVLIPARNEEENLPGCLASVAAQGEAVGEVLVYDDGSEDGTAAVGKAAGATLLSGSGLPEGWTGKTHACARLGEAARCPWLLFLDADARLAPGAVRALLEEAHRRDLTFLSAWPALTAVTPAEKLLMPLLNHFVLTTFPTFLAERSPLPALGIAHGAAILVRRETYLALGGHSRVRGEIFEDTALARVWREAGERSLCLDGQDLVRVRMYGSGGEIWRGFQKNFYPGFRRETSFWAFLAFRVGLFLLPFLGLAFGRGETRREAAAAAGAVVAGRLALVRRFGQASWSAFAHPAAEVFLLALGLASRRRARSGRGVEWKGRRYRSDQLRLEGGRDGRDGR